MVSLLTARFPYAYSAKAIGLIGFRWIYYYLMNYHYFLLDFCYFRYELSVRRNHFVALTMASNALVLAFLWYAPQNLFLFTVIYTFANGPLLWVHSQA